MARQGSNAATSTTRRRRPTAAEKAAAEATSTAQQDYLDATEATREVAEASSEATSTIEANPATETTNEAEEASTMSTDTIEPEVVETTDSDSTTAEAPAEKTAEQLAAEAKAAEEQKKLDDAYTEFEATVATALEGRDVSTGTLPVEQVELVKTSYRNLAGAKYKTKAKKHLNDRLKDAVNATDLVLGQAVMVLIDAADNAGSAPRPTAERKPADPAAAFREQLTVLHLAYMLASENAPEGVDAQAESGAVQEKVESLVDEARTYFAWSQSTAEDKGDEPEASAEVKKASKVARGKAASAGRAASATPRVSDGTRRNVRTHITQAFGENGSGTVMKISEIAKAVTAEYPDGSCSPGAIAAAFKSTKGVDGFALETNESGVAVARKL